MWGSKVDTYDMDMNNGAEKMVLTTLGGCEGRCSRACPQE